MNNKAGIGGILGILFAISVIGTGVYYFSSGGEMPQFAVLGTDPIAGCQPIESSPGVITREITGASAGYFKCESDQCKVKGAFTLNKPDGTTNVQCTSCVSPRNFKSESECKSQPTRCYSGSCSSQNCHAVSTPKYFGNFNFCNPADKSYKYCEGSANYIEGSANAVMVMSEYVYLKRNEWIEFKPTQSSDNSPGYNPRLYVEEYDCSCLPEIEAGRACTPDQKMCVIATEEYTINNNCYGSNSIFAAFRCNDGTAPFRKNGQGGCGSTLSKPYCTTPAYNKYYACTSTQQIGASTCGKFDTSKTYSCLAGVEICRVFSTGLEGLGVGTCSNGLDRCSVGAKQYVDSTHYKECIKPTTGYADWSGVRSCGDLTDGLVFSSIAQDCVCSDTNACIPGTSRCIGDQISYCGLKTFTYGLSSQKQCYKWLDKQNCPGIENPHQSCEETGTEYDFCSCKFSNQCTLGKIKCVNADSYQVCETNPSDQNSCLGYRRSYPVGEYERCETQSNGEGKLVPIPHGCAYQSTSPGLACADTKDSNNYPVETCVDNSCVCNPDTACTQGDVRCLGDKYQTCKAYVVGSKTCYAWSQSTSCLGDKKCEVVPNSKDICSCKNSDSCVANSKQCIDTKSYKICQTDLNNENSCLAYRGLNQINGYISCSNGVLNEIPHGCAYPDVSPELVCASTKDGNSKLVESCVDNKCICVQDNRSATAIQSGKTRCVGDKNAEIVKSYLAKSNTCYRWESYTAWTPCDINSVCRNIDNNAKCVPNYDFVGILIKESYGVGEQINNIIIDVTSTYGDNKNVKVTAELYEGDVILKDLTGNNIRVDTATNNLGKAYINFNYGLQKTAKLTIKVRVGADDKLFVTQKEINILKSLKIRLNCDYQAYINRPAKCTWEPVDSGTSQAIALQNVAVSARQGGYELPYTFSGTTAITFTPTSVGPVNVTVLGTTTGYLQGKESVSIYANSVETSTTYLVDGKDVMSDKNVEANELVELQVKLDDSGVPLAVSSFKATVRNPSGLEKDIVFRETPSGSGIWKTTYNFEQAGHTYYIKGTVTPADYSKVSIPISFEVITNAAAGETKDVTNYTIIGGAIALLVVMVLGAIAFRRKRR